MRVLVQEHVRNPHCLVQQPAWVAAQIQDQSVELASVQLLQSRGNVAIRILTLEAGQSDVPNLGPHQK